VLSDGNIEAIHFDHTELSLQASVIYERSLGRSIQNGPEDFLLPSAYQNTYISESRCFVCVCVCENIPTTKTKKLK
jgi:hypothetical protein